MFAGILAGIKPPPLQGVLANTRKKGDIFIGGQTMFTPLPELFSIDLAASLTCSMGR